ncbi:MAG: hydrogenase-4 component G [Campylobacter sp.]|nr:hydrogenase-4 component G [Campylobacter sp.]
MQNAIQGGSAEEIKEMASKLDAKSITNSYFLEMMNITSKTSSNTSAQSALFGFAGGDDSLLNILSGIDTDLIGYSGKPLHLLNQDEAKALVSEDGFFGIKNTADRIANFIISAAGGDVEKLQEGLEGMKRGFDEAEKIWGSKLPDISQKTMTAALESVGEAIATARGETNGNALNIEA